MKMQKYYFEELESQLLGFDANDLSDLWHDDLDGLGHYTLDEEEYEWFVNLAKAYELINEHGDSDTLNQCNDYQDIIDYGLSLEKVELVG